jgi:molybdate transport system substrate-binding protein
LSIGLGLLLAVGCSAPTARPLEIFVASSMARVVGELINAFEEQHEGLAFRLNVAGSQVLRMQIEQGAVADVYISANPAHADALHRSGALETPRVIAHNHLALIQLSRNRPPLTWATLGRAKSLVIGSPEVPIGAYTDALFQRARKRFGDHYKPGLAVVSREENVGILRAKVLLGAARAAVVYRSDALGFKELRSLPLPKELDAKTRCVAAELTGSSHKQAAAFMNFLSSKKALLIFQAHGFELPQ